MLIRYPLAGVILCVVCIVFSVSITIAAECQQRDNFSDWLEHFRQEATSQGISQQTIGSALNGITYDPAIITRDHSQKVFQQSLRSFPAEWYRPTVCARERICSSDTAQYSNGSRTAMVYREKCWSPSGDLRATTESTRANIQRPARWQHWP